MTVEIKTNTLSEAKDILRKPAYQNSEFIIDIRLLPEEGKGEENGTGNKK